MRTLLMALAVALSGMTLTIPANAQNREEFLRKTHWECEHGNQEACRIHHLYRECEEGNRRACEEIERERYHERWREHEHEHEHEHDHW